MTLVQGEPVPTFVAIAQYALAAYSAAAPITETPPPVLSQPPVEVKEEKYIPNAGTEAAVSVKAECMAMVRRLITTHVAWQLKDVLPSI